MQEKNSTFFLFLKIVYLRHFSGIKLFRLVMHIIFQFRHTNSVTKKIRRNAICLKMITTRTTIRIRISRMARISLRTRQATILTAQTARTARTAQRTAARTVIRRTTTKKNPASAGGTYEGSHARSFVILSFCIFFSDFQKLFDTPAHGL